MTKVGYNVAVEPNFDLLQINIQKFGNLQKYQLLIQKMPNKNTCLNQ